MSEEKTENQQEDFRTSFLKEKVLFVEICFNGTNHLTDLAEEMRKLIRTTGRVFYTLENADLIIAMAWNESAEEKEIIQRIFEIVERENASGCNVVFGTTENKTGGIRICPCSEYTEAQREIKSKFEKVLSECGISNSKLTRIETELVQRMQTYLRIRNKKMLAFSHSLLQIIRMIQQSKKMNQNNNFYIFYPQVALFAQLFKAGEEKLKEEKLKVENNKLKTEDEFLSEHLREINKLSYEESQRQYEECQIKYEEYKREYETKAKQYNQKKYQIIEELERSFRDFIDITEILLHQVGHSSKSIFEHKSPDLFPDDIPIKLCFLYIAYMHEVTYLLNDIESNEYRYCLSPLAYSVPETECFEFGLPPGNRLIKVMISRHMMYTPRSLFIILAHEVSHYVNDRIRNRELRSECMEKMLGTVFTEFFYDIDLSKIVSETDSEEDFEEVKLYYEWSKKNTKGFINKKIEHLMKKKKEANEQPENITWKEEEGQ